MARPLARLLPAITTAVLLVPLVSGQQPPPDVVLVNGRVFTADARRPYVEALAIRGDRVVTVGTSAQITALTGPTTRRIDVGGRVVIPGINDAHYHLFVEPPVVSLPFESMDPTWEDVKTALAAAIPRWRLIMPSCSAPGRRTPGF